jgi:hypothetical protein
VEALCLVLAEYMVAVLAVSVEVTVLTVMAGLSKTTVFVDVFVQGGAWCRLGLRSRNLIPSFVGWSCRDFLS